MSWVNMEHVDWVSIKCYNQWLLIVSVLGNMNEWVFKSAELWVRIEHFYWVSMEHIKWVSG